MAAEKHPRDILLNTMRDVLEKKAAKSEFIDQTEISELYNSYINFLDHTQNLKKNFQSFCLKII